MSHSVQGGTKPHGLSERELADILDPWEDPTAQGPHLLPAEAVEEQQAGLEHASQTQHGLATSASD